MRGTSAFDSIPEVNVSDVSGRGLTAASRGRALISQSKRAANVVIMA
jgi:hypothetical protein